MKRGWFKEIFSGTLGATAALTIRELIASLGKKGHEIVVEKINGLIKDNPRADLLYVMFALDPADAEMLWKRHLEAIATGTENDFVRIMGQALPRDKDGKVDMVRAKAVFSQIAQMDEARFCQIYEELNHDPIAQKVRHVLKHGASFAEAILEGLAYSAGIAVRAANGIDEAAAQAAVTINQWRVDSELHGVNRQRQPRRTLWTWFASKHRGLV